MYFLVYERNNLTTITLCYLNLLIIQDFTKITMVVNI